MNAAASNHPPPEFLQAFGLGKLDDASATSVSLHLESCTDCQRHVAELSSDSLLDHLRQANGAMSTSAPRETLTPQAPIRKPKPAAPLPAAPRPANLPAELLNNAQYDIIRELGAGGMGVVYLAKNKLMDRLEVLKVISTAMVHKASALDRFLREIRSAAALSHDNVVKAYSALQFGELLVFAMEYVEGDDLAKVLKSQGQMPIANACFYTRQVALGLQHAHEKNMVHRDIKPHNLILARDGKKHVVKILDFGLAKASSEKKLDRDLTGEGRMLGTPDYMAPEQIQDAAKADIRADIYSLGCTLYYFLTGTTPFNANSLYGLLQAHQTLEAKSVNLVRPEVPVELGAIVAKMMAKDPAKRYQKPIDVAQALAPFFGKAGAKGPSPAPALSVGDAAKAARPNAPKHAEAIAPIPIATPVRHATMIAANPFSLPPEAEATKPTPKAPKVRTPRRVKPMQLAAVAVGVAFLGLVITSVGGIILRVESKEGTLIIKSDDPNAIVKVTPEGGATLTYGKDRREIQLKPGKYGIELADAKSGLKLSVTKLTLPAGGEKTVEISWEKKLDAPGKVAEASPQKNIDPDRKAAEYVLSIGGVVRVNDEVDDNRAVGELPKTPFRLTYVDLHRNPKLRNAGLAAFEGCKNVSVLDLRFTQVKDAGLIHLKDCKNLRDLLLDHTHVTDEGPAHFEGCKNLVHLGLEGTNVGDVGLAAFKDCDKLEHIGLQDTQVRDNGLAHFKDCKTFKILNLSRTKVSDTGLAYFKDCKHLTQLQLWDTQVTNAGLAHFKDCKDLTHLLLVGTRVDDAGIAHFKDCKNLTAIDLYRSKVSDKSVAFFLDCKKLTYLYLEKTNVTAKAIEELKKALPTCRIPWESTAAGQPKPAAPTPEKPGDADAKGFVALFNGKDLTGWVGANKKLAAWNVFDGELVVVPGRGDISTTQNFGPNFELHVEFNVPLEANRNGQARGNSGIFLLGRHEIQILDSFGNPQPPDQSCGALFGQIGPSKNVCKPPNEWQTFDITFHAPRIAGKLQPGELSVVHNGVLVIDKYKVGNPTWGAPFSDVRSSGPIVLQNHGSGVRFRNLNIKTIP